MKARLRKEILGKRKDLSKIERQEGSLEIRNYILNGKEYQDAKRIFIFVSMEEEIDTHPLIKQAWQEGKEVAVPIAKKGGKMYFVHLKSFAELKRTSFGVLEPQKEESEAMIPHENDLFIVPGSVFDTRGNRYGYGAGFYDRYFQCYPDVFKMGVAFSFQVMEFELQVEEYDIPVDCIVTEKGLIGGNKREYFN